MPASDQGDALPDGSRLATAADYAALRFSAVWPDNKTAMAAIDSRLTTLGPVLRMAATILAFDDSTLEARLRTDPLSGGDMLSFLDTATPHLTALSDTIRAAQISLLAVLTRIVEED